MKSRVDGTSSLQSRAVPESFLGLFRHLEIIMKLVDQSYPGALKPGKALVDLIGRSKEQLSLVREDFQEASIKRLRQRQ